MKEKHMLTLKTKITLRLTKHLAHRIEILMAIHGLSRKGLAKGIGQSYQMTYLHLTGKLPMSLERFTKLCSTLKVGQDELLASREEFAGAVSSLLA